MTKRFSHFSLVHIGLWLALCVSGVARAQDTKHALTPAVAAAAALEQARFLADNEAASLRLEVFTLGAARLYDSDFHAGNLLDWKWQDQGGNRLADGVYRCVVTVKDLAGQFSQRQGILLMQNGTAIWQAPEQAEAALRNTTMANDRIAYFATVTNPADLAAAVLAHDGKDARLMTGSGALLFSSGNFLKGEDKQQMRLTSDGNLEVNGTVRTGEGIVFPDGTVQKTAYVASGQTLKQIAEDGKPVKASPNSPSAILGTPNRLPKFGPDGVSLLDSTVTDLGPGGGISVNGSVLSSFNNVSATADVPGGFMAYWPSGSNRALLLRSASLSGNLWIGNLGNVGLGITNPGSRFATGGNATVGAGFYNIAAPSNSLVVEDRLGVGTANPLRQVQIGSSTDALFTLDATNGTPNAGFIRFGDNTGWKLHFGRNREVSAGTLNTGNTGILMTLQDNGYVGINTTTPNARLHVSDPILATNAAVIRGETTSNASQASAIVGQVNQTSAGSFSAAVRGIHSGLSGSGIGVWGSHAGSGWGVFGQAGGAGLAGNFSGNVAISGTLSKSSGSFKIDHPLDPENKYLYHSFVESPDMMNIYNGVVTLGESGRATVPLPEWFESLNSDFRYQLTAVGAPGPNLHVAQEVNGNQFEIAGGMPGMKVSWQVTGIRKDAFAQEHRIPVEELKKPEDRGTYLHPEAFGKPAERGETATQIRRAQEQAKVEKSPKDEQKKP